MESLRDLADDLESAIKVVEPRAPYVEAMGQSQVGGRFLHDKAQTTVEPVPLLRGVAIRAWSGGLWHDVAVTGLDRETLLRGGRSLFDRIGGSNGSKGPPGTSPTGRAESVSVERRSLDDYSLERQRAFARQVFDWATGVPGIQNAIVRTGWSRAERLLVTSAGCRQYQRVGRTIGSVLALAIANGKVDYDFDIRGEQAGTETLDYFDEPRVREVAQRALEMLKAEAPPVGEHPVVLDPSTAGTFAHESFGHGTEADQLLRDRSYLKPHLGEMVGPESLSLIDDGSLPRAWGSISFDDEGHASRRTALVDHGRFVQVLHDRVSAEAMGSTPTGNTRRADYLSRPFVRMTNTLVEPGDWSREELLEEAKDGVLLENCTSGIEDPLGGQMQIKVKRGHRIEHGQVTGLVRSMALSGKVLEFLQAIRGIGRSDDVEMSAGTCGKGHTDLLPTGTGGPYLLSRAIVGPA